MNKLQRETLKVGDKVTYLHRAKSRGISYLPARVTGLTPSKLKASIRLVKRNRLLKTILMTVGTNDLVPGHVNAEIAAKNDFEYKVKGQKPTEIYFVAAATKSKRLPSPTESIGGIFYNVDNAIRFRKQEQVKRDDELGIYIGVFVVRSKLKTLHPSLVR